MTRTAQSASQDVRELELDEIARDALHCIEIVANTAESLLHGHRSGKPESFATVNTWTSGAQVENLKAINESERAALTELIGQPVIARVDLADENGVVETVFITRSTPPSNTGYRIASYRSFLGSIAARDVGDDLSLRIGGCRLQRRQSSRQ
ncbi:hypothetical protein [Limimaricola hongkongensis]|uniref:hypothetical protein n=1 Tax=Limimaricola hongkongensis TaxID=278132 RepID=UPI0013A55587|nr:hypothetical protein [Limimaricola hongkongensis]